MNKSKERRKVAPANEKKATKKDEDWKEKCKDCEFLRLYNECFFGCEVIDSSINRKGKKSSK